MTFSSVLVWMLLVVSGTIGWYRQVDRLSDPATVTTWTTTGLVLGDGRRLDLPGIARITGSPRSLQRLVERGVEVQASGRVAVLVRIYSGCGNCNACTERRLAYDLSAVLVLLRLADPDASFKRGTRLETWAREALDDDRGWEWGLTKMGGDVAALEELCERNGIPLAEHAPIELATPW